MTYKVTCDIPGEPKSRQIFCPTRLATGAAATQMLADPTVPVGTVVRVTAEREEVVGEYTKKGKVEKGEEETTNAVS